MRPRTPAAPADPDDEADYVPPVPPPLPTLDPVAKGAWAALFGGPGVPADRDAGQLAGAGLGGFLAMGAFVGGFATLVVRLETSPRADSGPDDGAVV